MIQQPSLCSFSFSLADFSHSVLVRTSLFLPDMCASLCTSHQVKHLIKARWFSMHPCSPFRRLRDTVCQPQLMPPPQQQGRGSTQAAQAALVLWHSTSLCNPSPQCHSTSVSAVSVPEQECCRTALLAAEHSWDSGSAHTSCCSVWAFVCTVHRCSLHPAFSHPHCSWWR